MTDKIIAPKGLAGVVTDETAISKVMPESNSLTYRGYRVQDLSEHCNFEEVAYLLVHEDLPTTEALKTFANTERAYRNLSNDFRGGSGSAGLGADDLSARHAGDRGHRSAAPYHPFRRQPRARCPRHIGWTGWCLPVWPSGDPAQAAV